MNLVLVYLGNKVPSFIYDNLNYLVKTFPQYETYIILDIKSSKKFKTPNKVKVWIFEEDDNSDLKALNFLQHDAQFRNGFWSLTIKRLFAVTNFMENMQVKNVLHIESDVWLSPSYPFNKLISSPHGISYPLSNLSEGVASTLYIRNIENGKRLARYALAEIERNPDSTDCTILGSLYADPDEGHAVGILPTIIPLSLNLNAGLDPVRFNIMSSAIEYFGGLFDAATWGQYLLGIDARNTAGYKHVYATQSHHPCNPHATKILFDELSQSPIVSVNESRWPIFSLHIHSKSKAAFVYPARLSEVARRADVLDKSPRREIAVNLFTLAIIKRVINFVYRRANSYKK
jgi:hypothetical protein